MLKTSSRIDCPLCLDIGSGVSGPLGIDEKALADLPCYAESDRFSALEEGAFALGIGAMGFAAGGFCLAPDQQGGDAA